MVTLAPELKEWMSARTPDERQAMLGVLASEYLSGCQRMPLAVQNQNQDTIGFLVPGSSSAVWPMSPERLAELRRRAEKPSEDSLTVDEFLTALKTEQPPNR